MTKQGCSSKGQTLLWRIVNRKSVRRTIGAAGWWSLEQDLVAGAGLDSWYKTGIRWIGGCWCRTGIYWRRKVFAGSGLVVAGISWYRKVVAGSGLVVTGAELVTAEICWCRKVDAGVRWCRKVVAGLGLVVAGVCGCKKLVAAAVKWLPWVVLMCSCCWLGFSRRTTREESGFLPHPGRLQPNWFDLVWYRCFDSYPVPLRYVVYVGWPCLLLLYYSEKLHSNSTMCF